MRFEATVQLKGKTATGISVPSEIVAALGSSKRPVVRVTINGYTYCTTIASMAGEFMLSVSAEVRENAGIAAGDQVEVEIERNEELRTVEVPIDLAAALDSPTGARKSFDELAYSKRKEYVRQVEAAKTQATRERRIASIVAQMSAL